MEKLGNATNSHDIERHGAQCVFKANIQIQSNIFFVTFSEFFDTVSIDLE